MKKTLFCLVLLLLAAGCAPTVDPNLPTPTWAVNYPTAAPLPGELPPAAGGFTPQAPAGTFGAGEVAGLAFGPDGAAWLLLVDGALRWDGSAWQATPLHDGLLVGLDGRGWLWATPLDGRSLFAWDGAAWRVFGPPSGWAPVEDFVLIPVPQGLETDPDGVLWLSTAQDVRRFDGQTWQVYPQADWGLPESESFDYKPILSLALDSGGAPWVGVCDWGGPGPLSGRALRRLEGGNWIDPGLPLERPCVTALAAGKDGALWVGVEQSLWRFSAGEWSELALPQPEDLPADRRPGYISRVWLDGLGQPWVSATLCGESSCDNGQVLFAWQGGEWRQQSRVSATETWTLLFDRGGAAWLFSPAGVFRPRDGALAAVPGAPLPLAAAQDAQGAIWLVGSADGQTALYRLGE